MSIPEPDFMGLKCTGQDEARAKKFQDQADAANLGAKFYQLDRHQQLIIAAAVTEMLTKR